MMSTIMWILKYLVSHFDGGYLFRLSGFQDVGTLRLQFVLFSAQLLLY